MELRARFAVLALVITMLPSQLFPQEATTKQQESTTAEQVSGNTAHAKTHCDVPSCVQKILYFSNVWQANDLQDVTNAMRTMVEISRIQQVPSARIIIIEGTPEQVAMGERLAAEIDRDLKKFGGTGYRIELKVQESLSDKKVQTRVYSFLTDAREIARVSTVRPAPVGAQNEPVPENTQPPDSGNARNVDCRIVGENEHTVELSVELTAASGGESAAANSPSLRIRQHVTVELGKSTTISKIDDPDGNRSFTIELTATRIKEKS